jgi:hypothetical protein
MHPVVSSLMRRYDGAVYTTINSNENSQNRHHYVNVCLFVIGSAPSYLFISFKFNLLCLLVRFCCAFKSHARNRYCHDAQDGQGLDTVFTYRSNKLVDQSFLQKKIFAIFLYTQMALEDCLSTCHRWDNGDSDKFTISCSCTILTFGCQTIFHHV